MYIFFILLLLLLIKLFLFFFLQQSLNVISSFVLDSHTRNLILTSFSPSSLPFLPFLPNPLSFSSRGMAILSTKSMFPPCSSRSLFPLFVSPPPLPLLLPPFPFFTVSFLSLLSFLPLSPALLHEVGQELLTKTRVGVGAGTLVAVERNLILQVDLYLYVP